MKNTYLTPTVLAIAALLAACGSSPNTTSLLDQTRSDYRIAQSNPNVATYAPLEMKQATDAMTLVNTAASERDSDEKIDKLAYLARQKIALTQEVTKQKMAEAEVANAGKERDQIRLAQRTNEADAANIRAEQSRQVALLAINDAARAQQQNQLAQADVANAEMRTAQLEAQLAELAAKKTERGIVITLGDVLFGTDLARLTSDGIATVQKLAKVLQNNPQRKVLIEGFADSTGTAMHNQQLSERRANAVQNTLQDLGIGSERIAMRGYGESYPVAANDSAQNRQLNRRVEIVLSDDSGQVKAR